MSIPPIVVTAARSSWNWQWNQLMNGLAPSDNEGRYTRPSSQCQEAVIPSEKSLKNRDKQHLPCLIIGRSCPWAHRTWLTYQLRELSSSISLLIANVSHKEGRWKIEPPWLECDSLLNLYKRCNVPPTHRATVPALIDPGENSSKNPQLLGNESAQLVEVLNEWPTENNTLNLYPKNYREEIDSWQKVLQPHVNDGVYRCGFARNQYAYENASNFLFEALEKVESNLAKKKLWLCGDDLTLADIRLFPTLIRWEVVYMPLFKCTQKPLWAFPHLWEWRKRFYALPNIAQTCDANAWSKDYFGALFPLNPSNIVPKAPNLNKMVNWETPKV